MPKHTDKQTGESLIMLSDWVLFNSVPALRRKTLHCTFLNNCVETTVLENILQKDLRQSLQGYYLTNDVGITCTDHFALASITMAKQNDECTVNGGLFFFSVYSTVLTNPALYREVH